jgi:hypothetical protein
MTEEKTSERCLCQDLSDAFSRMSRAFGVSETAQDHFRQSRIEMLKGIRKMVDDRIEHVSRSGTHKGTRVVVE